MTRILFVDDEPQVLRGLERMLSGADCDWETEFAEGGPAALTLLAQRPFDVVVTDMRMPGMDGAALLKEVMRLYPAAVRIVLSGHSERELILRSVAVAHQYLAKPCDPSELMTVITRAVRLRQFLSEPALRTLVAQLERLPSMPQRYRDLMAQIECSNKSLRELGSIVAQDVGMTAKILQIVNSAFFGLPRRVSDPVQAVCLLGLDVLAALVMTVHVFSELPLDSVNGLRLADLWKHSAETGAIARMIASALACDREVCDQALVAGLLHDAGKLILIANQTERYRQALRLAKERATPILVAEHEVLGTTHAEVGAYLLGLWGLPDPTVEAVAYHHRPRDCGVNAVAPLTAVHAADALQHAHEDMNRGQPPDPPDPQYLEQLGLAGEWPKWWEQTRERAGR
ncbi:MAG: response regulator [Planctomycetota bacterium]